MARRTTGSKPPAAPRPLVETNGPLAIQILENWYAKFDEWCAKVEDLETRDLSAIRGAPSYVLDDAKKVFGYDAPEPSQVWQHPDIVADRYLPLHDEDDGYGDPFPASISYTKIRPGLESMKALIGRLVERAKDLAARHGSLKGKPMSSLIDDLGDRIRAREGRGGARTRTRRVG